jgi:hypothetical protein
VWYDEGDDDRQFGAHRMIHVPLDAHFPTAQERQEREEEESVRRRAAEEEKGREGREQAVHSDEDTRKGEN